MQLALIVIVVVFVGGTVIATIWWRLADKFFPGTAAKMGQDVPRARPAHKAGAVVIKGFDPVGPERGGPGA